MYFNVSFKLIRDDATEKRSFIISALFNQL